MVRKKKKDLKQDERQSAVQTTNNIRDRGAMGLFFFFFYKNVHLRNGLNIKLLSLRMNVISHYNYVLNVRLCDNDSIKFSQH